MAKKGYCNVTDVAEFLGKSLTDAQGAHCEALIERMENHIDNRTRRGWLEGAQTNERIEVTGQNVYLRYTPVESVSSITGRSGLGESDETLTVDEDYEVIDLEKGYIRLVYPGNYDRLLVTYTQADEVPGDIQQACIELVAARMQLHLMPGSYGLDSYSLPDLTVKFSRGHMQQAEPPAVRSTLEYYRYPVHA